MHDINELKRDLEKLGIENGDSVLMHSSYKSLGGLEGGAQAFFDAFIDLLGPDGTLVLPALSYEYVTKENPVFDIKNTPSCVGYLTEYFRTKVSGVKRSLHATHSCCAYGRYRDFLIENHEKDMTPVGENSPFYKLPQINGKILFLGCSPDHNTSMHGVEETVTDRMFIDFTNTIDYVLKDENGIEHTVTSYRHHFEREKGFYEQRYSRIINLLDESECAKGKVLEADCVLMDAKAVWQKGHDMLEKDGFFFVEWADTIA